MKGETLTRSGVIKDSLSKDHDHQGMDKKIHTDHPGKNAHDKCPSWKAKTLIRSGVIEDSLPKDHNPWSVDKEFFAVQPGKSTQESCLKLKF